MTVTEPVPDLPRARPRSTLLIKVVHDHADRIFLWNYDRARPQLVTLYNKAMASQWNSVTELDWETEVDPEALVDMDSPLMRLTRGGPRGRRLAGGQLG